MKCGFASFCGVPAIPIFSIGFALGAEMPDEVKTFCDTAVSDSAKVRVSVETLKVNYQILEAEETPFEATYKVADMPQKGVCATFFTGEPLARLVTFTRKLGNRHPSTAEKNMLNGKPKWIQKKEIIPNPFPESVVYVDEKAGKQTKYKFTTEGMLIIYLAHFDELTQAVKITFHDRTEHQVSDFLKVQNGSATGLEYDFDKEGRIAKTVDHGPPRNERRSSISWNEYTIPIVFTKKDTQLFMFGVIDEILNSPESMDFLKSPEGEAFIKSPEGKAYFETPEGKAFLESPEGRKLIQQGLLKQPL